MSSNGKKIDLTTDSLIRELFEESADAILLLYDSYKIAFANTQFYNITSFKREYLIGQSLLSIITNESVASFESILSGNIVFSPQFFQFKLSHNKNIPFKITSIKVFEQIDRILLSIETSNNSLQTKKVDRNTFDTIFEMNALGISLVNKANQIITVNHRFCEILGYEQNELQGLSFLDITHPDDRNIDILQTVENSASKWVSFEKRYVKKSGEIIWASISISVIENNKSDIFYIATIRNITGEQASIQKERQLFIQQSKLEANQRELAANALEVSRTNRFLQEIENNLKDIVSTDEPTNKKIQTIIRQISTELQSKENPNSFELYFRNIHPTFFEKLTKQSTKLTPNELRHCAYIKMQLTNKEVADMMFVQPRTVEIARYRIKQKLDLPKKMKLTAYINSL